jgi:2,3-bisphosphoglycerate-independent phosphoglycerate mutase
LAAVCAASPVCAIADIVGRYYAMDRDHRPRASPVAYELIVDGRRLFRSDAEAACRGLCPGENDEFVKPTLIGAPAPMQVSATSWCS